MKEAKSHPIKFWEMISKVTVTNQCPEYFIKICMKYDINARLVVKENEKGA